MKLTNRDSRDFEFIDKFEAGIVLTGSDAKSLRTQGVDFNGSRIDLVGGYPELVNLAIRPYKYSQNQVTDQTASRRLLLKDREIAKLQSYRHQKYMLVPVSIYTKGKWFKVEIGVGRKMRKYEKREKIKSREIKRGIRN